jgi:hypothetical protein
MNKLNEYINNPANVDLSNRHNLRVRSIHKIKKEFDFIAGCLNSLDSMDNKVRNEFLTCLNNLINHKGITPTLSKKPHRSKIINTIVSKIPTSEIPEAIKEFETEFLRIKQGLIDSQIISSTNKSQTQLIKEYPELSKLTVEDYQTLLKKLKCSSATQLLKQDKKKFSVAINKIIKDSPIYSQYAIRNKCIRTLMKTQWINEAFILLLKKPNSSVSELTAATMKYQRLRIKFNEFVDAGFLSANRNSKPLRYILTDAGKDLAECLNKGEIYVRLKYGSTA